MLKTALAALLVTVTAAGAQTLDRPAYDVKIEQAVKKIVAKKVGAIRGGVDVHAGLTGMPTDEPEEAEPQLLASLAMEVDDALQTASLEPARAYQSGRPEPRHRVRKVSSFLFY